MPRPAPAALSAVSRCRDALCLLLVAALLSGQCLLAPAALAWGEFTLQKEKELGDKFNVMVRSRLPLVQDPEVVDYVTGIVNRLSRSLPPQPFPFTVSVLRDNAVNAFATPGGYVFVHTGLILAMRHESEVAGVIAHEMAHVTQRHIANRIESAQWISILSLLGALAGAFLGGQGGQAAMAASVAGGQAAMLDYSREDEREADQVGMNLLTQAGYPPQGMVGAFQVLSRRQWISGRSIPGYLSTHPGLQERVRDMSVRVGRLSESARSKQENDSHFLRIQALVRARYSDPQVAERVFAQQMSGPNRCITLMGQGILASRQNRVNDAAKAFTDALACSPKDQLIIREAGRFHYTKGNMQTGTRYLEEAVRMNRNDTMALYYYSRCLGDSGRTAEAIDYTRQVLRKVPEDAEIHEQLAKLYGASGMLFLANLHLAYSALYENNKTKTAQFKDKAKGLARTPEDNSRLAFFEHVYNTRKEFWK